MIDTSTIKELIQSTTGSKETVDAARAEMFTSIIAPMEDLFKKGSIDATIYTQNVATVLTELGKEYIDSIMTYEATIKVADAQVEKLQAETQEILQRVKTSAAQEALYNAQTAEVLAKLGGRTITYSYKYIDANGNELSTTEAMFNQGYIELSGKKYPVYRVSSIGTGIDTKSIYDYQNLLVTANTAVAHASEREKNRMTIAYDDKMNVKGMEYLSQMSTLAINNGSAGAPQAYKNALAALHEVTGWSTGQTNFGAPSSF
jgi:hypothetical protein